MAIMAMPRQFSIITQMPKPKQQQQQRQLIIFFTLLLLSSLVHVTSNNEVDALFSWLRNSPSFSPHFSDWNPLDQTPCGWSHINCSSESHVTVINISGVELAVGFPPMLSSFPRLEKLVISSANLTGTISNDIRYCSELTVVDLSSNGLVGNIPSGIGKLRKLRELVLNSNKLTGEIPTELGDCAELRKLVVFDNFLGGNVPAELGRLVKLESIRAGGNKDIGGKIPAELGGCESLRVLGLADTRISGSIPAELGRLAKLETLSVYTAMLSGEIPPEIGNCSGLVELFLYENELSGVIPPELGRLGKLEKLLLWQNQLAGVIPEEIGAGCRGLRTVDLSLNYLSGKIPESFGNLSNLEELMLSNNNISGSIPLSLFGATSLVQLQLDANGISGNIPAEIGGCVSLVRVRLSENIIGGEIPREIGLLKGLSFLDLSGNRLSGPVPGEIGGCADLQLLNLGNNTLGGDLPKSLSSLTKLQVLDLSLNRFRGRIPEEFGGLSSLNSLVLSRNLLSGPIPTSLSQCSALQLLDLSRNGLSGAIPAEIFKIKALEIALNLSFNALSGPVPPEVSGLIKLSVLDLSHNELSGELSALAGLENLVSLNVSHNDFTGFLPDSKLFRQLSPTDLEANPGLRSAAAAPRTSRAWPRGLGLAAAALIALTVALVALGSFAAFRSRRALSDARGDETDGSEAPWQFTPFQKLSFTADQVLSSLTEPNVIGKGVSGVVYRAELGSGEAIAVKKLWPAATSSSKRRDSFSAEIETLGSIRHKNIVRFLGCCYNKKTRLLMYDYMANGSLGSLLHENNNGKKSGGGGCTLEWETRYKIVLGSAQGLAYLHHDCVPPIVHRDIKANNILIGDDFEAYIADFGLAKLVQDGDFGRSSSTVAGSYGYIAPEYGYMMKITEKSDVYSFGVVLLEVLTGKQPIDPTIPEGLHIVDWVRRRRGSGPEVLDPSLRAQPCPDVEEMLQTLGVALLCVNPAPDDRPTMKDVAAMLKEIRHQDNQGNKVDVLVLNKNVSFGSDHNVESNSSGSSSVVVGRPAIIRSNNTSFSASSLLNYSSSSNNAK